ncbi:MAG: YjgN family protein [Bacteroidota bacterium]
MENTSSLRELLNNDNPERNYPISFLGEGGEYFGVLIVNWLLTAITLGIYYPWAKARKLQFLFSATQFNGARFVFHGTGNEMFKGFIKAILIFVVLNALLAFFIWMQMPIVGIIIFYLCILALIPIAIHGSYKYRMSRTSWRSIRFGYRGDRKELVMLFLKNILLTIVTLGLYTPWLSMNLRNYILNRVKFGNLKFKYTGNGSEYFLLVLKGYLLSLVTLFIYMFWFQRNLLAYYIDNLSIANEDGTEVKMKCTATGGDFFKLLMGNFFLLIFTLGIGYSWVVCRTIRFLFSHMEIYGNLDFDKLIQSEANYTDATGEDLSDILDFGIVV